VFLELDMPHAPLTFSMIHYTTGLQVRHPNLFISLFLHI